MQSVSKPSLTLVRPAWIVAVHLALFGLARGLLYWIWREEFLDLTWRQVARAFLQGVGFDASVVVLGLSPVLLALTLPFGFARSTRWRTFWSWFAFAHLCLVTLVLAGDVAYFGLVGRHAGPEVVALVDDPRLLLSIVLADYKLELLGALLLLALLFRAWRSWMRRDERRPALRAPAWSLLLLAPLLLVVVRGNASGKPISVVDAFQSGSASCGYLTLNGPFSIVHSIFGSRDLPGEFLPWQEAVDSVRRQLLRSTDRALDPGYPLLRVPTIVRSRHPNVVVLLLESWDADVVDALRTRAGLAPLGLTPNFDALAGQGVLFTEFYAAGQRSTHGLLAVLAGLPSLPGVPYLGRGVEQSRLSFLGSLARAEGYATFLLQGSLERSFRVDAIAALAGFEHYTGMRGILERCGCEPMARWGAWDEDLLRVAHAQFLAARPPFLGLVFTTSTHLPYQVPEGHARPYPDDSQEHAYWNSIHYADQALGEFVAAARSGGYFDETVFVLLSDHRSGVGLVGRSPPELHHVPCLIVAPGLAARVEPGIASQLDVLATVADLAGWRSPQASLGRSLLDPERPPDHGALCMRNEVLLRIESDGWVSHDLTTRLQSGLRRPGADLDGIERRLLASVQVVARALRENRVLPADPLALAGAAPGPPPPARRGSSPRRAGGPRGRRHPARRRPQATGRRSGRSIGTRRR